MVDSRKKEVELEVNGISTKVRAYPMARLLDVLREEVELTGTKEGCGEGECGACSVFVDGKLVNSCLVPALAANGAKVETVEGLIQKGAPLEPIQQAFLDYGGAQCGICTPGMLLAAHSLLRSQKEPTRENIKDALAGNLCRCTGYMKIFESVYQALKNTETM